MARDPASALDSFLLDRGATALEHLNMDQPPALEPSEKLSGPELGELALKLLWEMAQNDPDLAARIAAMGLGPRD